MKISKRAIEKWLSNTTLTRIPEIKRPKIILKKQLKPMRCSEIRKKGIFMTNSVMRGFKEGASPGLADLKIFFPILEIFSKIFLASAAGGEKAAGPDREEVCDITWT